jgi:hypothetical protein
MQEAVEAGWGNRDALELEAAAERLRQLGYKVSLASGYVGWPNKQAQGAENLPKQGNADVQLIHQWTH